MGEIGEMHNGVSALIDDLPAYRLRRRLVLLAVNYDGCATRPNQ
jgi:hypothetical protein